MCIALELVGQIVNNPMDTTISTWKRAQRPTFAGTLVLCVINAHAQHHQHQHQQQYDNDINRQSLPIGRHYASIRSSGSVHEGGLCGKVRSEAAATAIWGDQKES